MMTMLRARAVTAVLFVVFVTVIADEVCFELSFETQPSTRYGCGESFIFGEQGTTFEYYVAAFNLTSSQPAGNTVIFADDCYLENSICFLEYCVTYEDISKSDVVLAVEQTTLRRNQNTLDQDDFWAFAVTLNGARLTPDGNCSVQLGVVFGSVPCICEQNFGFSSQNATAVFQLDMESIVSENIAEDSANDQVNLLAVVGFSFLGVVLMVGLAVRVLRNQPKRLASLSLPTIDDGDAGSINYNTAENSFDRFLTSTFAPAASLNRSGKKKQADAKDIESLNQIKELALRSSGLTLNGAFSPRLSASISFRVEQTLIKLEDVLIERLIFLIIEQLQVKGPGSTPRTTTFREEMAGRSEELRRIPLGSFMESLRDVVNEFTEEEDEDAGNSMGNKCLLVAFVYLKTAKSKNPDLVINDANIRNLLFIATLVATKFMDDFLIPNTYWSEFSEIDVESINEMEGSFCKYIDYDLFITPNDIKSVVSELERNITLKF